jgi:hypothetical protein
MINQLLELYKLIDSKKALFSDAGLSPDFYIDVFRGQPLHPELYEYFSIPAIFVDYNMRGAGRGNPRTITLTLHIITDTMPDCSNISEQNNDGLNRFLYLYKLQQILEGAKLGDTTGLVFIDEAPVEIPVVNYHTQSYSFNAYLSSMCGNEANVLGEIKSLNIYGSLFKIGSNMAKQ